MYCRRDHLKYTGTTNFRHRLLPHTIIHACLYTPQSYRYSVDGSKINNKIPINESSSTNICYYISFTLPVLRQKNKYSHGIAIFVSTLGKIRTN